MTVLLLKEIYGDFLDESRKRFSLRAWKELSDRLDKELETEQWMKDDNRLQFKGNKLKAMVGGYDKILGEGSSRVVVAIDSSKVLKQAINSRGRAQNEAEVDIYTNPVFKPIFAKVFQAADDYEWLISELVRPLSHSEFSNLSGIEWRVFEASLRYYESFYVKKNGLSPYAERTMQYARQTPESIEKLLKENNLLKSVVEAVDYGLSVGDLTHAGHWGKTASGRVVVLDYGLTEDVWKNYYANW